MSCKRYLPWLEDHLFQPGLLPGSNPPLCGDSNVDYSSDVVTVDPKAECNGHKKYAVDTCSFH